MKNETRTAPARVTVMPGVSRDEYRTESELQAGDSCLHISVRTTRHIPIKQGDSDGYTFGQILDRQLEEAAMAGDLIEGLELEISERQWRTYMERVRENVA